MLAQLYTYENNYIHIMKNYKTILTQLYKYENYIHITRYIKLYTQLHKYENNLWQTEERCSGTDN